MGRALEMVVLGDSILWGQGLREEQKLSSQVQGWLSRALGRPVRRRVHAHSGAVLLPDPEDGRPPQPGEVPLGYPSVTAQLHSVTDADGVDLVLLNGGLNDLNFRALLDPSAAESWVRAQARAFCAHGMRDVLAAAAARFPHAVIVAVSYYPLISRATSAIALCRVFAGLGWLRSAATAIGLRPKLAALSAAWHEASTKCLQWAADQVDGELSEAHARGCACRPRPGERPLHARVDPDGRRPRVLVARAPFAEEHTYAAPNTYLWRIGERDPVRERRVLECARSGRRVDQLCEEASAGHPNPRGAAAYAQAIIDTLRPVQHRWLADGEAAPPPPRALAPAA